MYKEYLFTFNDSLLLNDLTNISFVVFDDHRTASRIAGSYLMRLHYKRVRLFTSSNPPLKPS